jgi:hypothetical protein
MISIMKKQLFVALVLLLLIPVVWMLGGLVFSLINPEIAAGHPDYARNFHLLSLVKIVAALGSTALVGILWLLACFLVIQSKGRSSLWLFLAALGPFGFAILAILDDEAPAETDRHARFVRQVSGIVRVGYELCTFVVIWFVAFEAMVLMRSLIVMYQSATTGMSTAQIIDLQNASSGMWAFSEGLEVMYIVALLYLVRPLIFNTVGRAAAIVALRKAR